MSNLRLWTGQLRRAEIVSALGRWALPVRSPPGHPHHRASGRKRWGREMVPVRTETFSRPTRRILIAALAGGSRAISEAGCSGVTELELVFWIERLVSGAGRQTFVNAEHEQIFSYGSGPTLRCQTFERQLKLR